MTTSLLAIPLKNKKDSDKPFNLLTGAGCSKSAGIPLAGELVKEIHQKFGEECKHHLNEDQMVDTDYIDPQAIIHLHSQGTGKSLLNSNVYNLACAYSLLDEKDKCKEKLLRCRDAKTLPDIAHLREDKDLENVRGEPWFEELISSS